uniref:NADH-ubiquinone oxidoreductase chain 2 n=1 Tax=Engaeus lyelli TaxID=219696 RepID=W6MWM4_9EUCA|nr:NADH dehydrogenase subunit 2 [Engaeus lyelli]CDL72550.1 NADH dehydrogenase subunit 2 [Engaeus lyelli]
MIFSPFKMMFISSLFSGAILAISSGSWILAWIGLELNLMSFIPLIISKPNSLSSEASLKYFLIQALGSALIILAASLISLSLNLFLLTLSCALLMKMGSAPFHFWFPQVMEGMNWFHSSLLMTIQKLAPMFLISYLTPNNFCWIVIFFAASGSALIGALGGLNQTSMRKLLSFSSINHMSWMLFAMLTSEVLWALYFLLYSAIIISVTVLFSSLQVHYISSLTGTEESPLSKIISILSLFSLGGLPPFSGFIPKWIVVQEMASHSYFHALSLLLFCSLITLYFYIRLAISSLSQSAPQNKHQTTREPKISFQTLFFSFLNLFGLSLTSILIFT